MSYLDKQNTMSRRKKFTIWIISSIFLVIGIVALMNSTYAQDLINPQNTQLDFNKITDRPMNSDFLEIMPIPLFIYSIHPYQSEHRPDMTTVSIAENYNGQIQMLKGSPYFDDLVFFPHKKATQIFLVVFNYNPSIIISASKTADGITPMILHTSSLKFPQYNTTNYWSFELNMTLIKQQQAPTVDVPMEWTFPIIANKTLGVSP